MSLEGLIDAPTLNLNAKRRPYGAQALTRVEDQ